MNRGVNTCEILFLNGELFGAEDLLSKLLFGNVAEVLKSEFLVLHPLARFAAFDAWWDQLLEFCMK